MNHLNNDSLIQCHGDTPVKLIDYAIQFSRLYYEYDKNQGVNFWNGHKIRSNIY